MSLRVPTMGRRPLAIARAAAVSALAAACLTAFAPFASASVMPAPLPPVTPFVATVVAPAAGLSVSGSFKLVGHITDTSSAGHFTITSLLGGGPVSVPAVVDGVDPLTWNATWNSAAVANGGYTVTFGAVRAADGAATESVGTSFTVNNVVAPPPALSVLISVPAAAMTLTGAASFAATTNVAADSLTFAVTPTLGGGSTSIPAVMRDSTHWVATWDSTTVPNGAYTIVARAFQGGTFTDSDPVSVTVSNAAAAPVLAVTLSAPASGAVLAGSVAFNASTNVSAASVTFRVLDVAGAVVASVIGTSGDGLSWTATWDTTSVPNAAYVANASATGAGPAAVSGRIAITVSNVAPVTPPVEPMAVTLLAPTGGATVSGAVALTAQTTVAADSLVFVITKNFGDFASVTLPATGGGTSWSGRWDTAAQPDGLYAVVARATKAGVDTPATTATVTLSNAVAPSAGGTPTPLAVTLVSPSSGVTLSGTATLIAGTNVAAGSLVFAFRDPVNPDVAPVASVPAVAGAGNTAWTATVDTATVPNGTYAIVARATKDAVVVSGPAIRVNVLNAVAGGTTEPVAFTVTLPVAGASLSGTVGLSATANQPIDGFTFSVAGTAPSAAQQTITAAGNGVKTVWNAAWDTSSVPNGDYVLQTTASKGGHETHGPPVAFKVANSSISVSVTSPSAGETVSGTKEIVIAAMPSADTVSVTIASAADPKLTSTRNATFDAGRQVWATQWNTVDFPNGSYRLEVKAVSADGRDFFANPVAVSVANPAAPANEAVAVRMAAPNAGATVSGTVTLEAAATGAVVGVQFFVAPDGGGAVIRVDGRFDAGRGRWIGAWKTDMTPNGAASIGAVAVTGQNVKVESPKMAVTVENAAAAPVPVQTPFSVALLEPSSGNASGVVRFVAKTEGIAAGVTVFVKLRSSAVEPRAVAAAFDAGRGMWFASWDTAAEEIGTYDAVAVAKKADGAQTTSPNVVTLFVEKREQTGGAPSPEPPVQTAPLVITRPLPDAALHGMAVLIAESPRAAKVVFDVRSSDGAAVATLAATKGSEGWSVLWDTSAAANGNYVIEAAASDDAGARFGTARVGVTVDNGLGREVTSIDVVPADTIAAVIREVPPGSTALAPEQLPKGMDAAVTRLSEECVAAHIPKERCDEWLAARHQSPECRDAGIVTKEECVAFLERKNGGQMPDCKAGEGACADAIAKATAGLLGANELRDIRDAVTPHIGQTYVIVPPGTAPETPGQPGAAAEKKAEGTEAPPVIADLIPLVSDRPLTVNVHASPGFGESGDHVSHAAVPALLFIDSDGDGLPDDVERRIGTDPFNKDTDGDGFDDGTEVRMGYNPLGKGRLADGVKNLAPVDVAIVSGVPIEQPTTAGKESTTLKVEDAASPSGTGKKTFTLSGRAHPGEVVTLFVYSYLPVVLTTEAKDDGTWSYDLDSGLSNGQHEVYATVTDETGKIKEKSSPLAFFVSEAKAVTQDQFFQPESMSPLAAAAVQEPVRKLAGWYIGGAALLIVLALVISYFLFLKPKKPEPPPGP